METVILLILAGVCAVFAFRMFSMVIRYDIMRVKHNKEEKEKNKNKQIEYIVVEEDDDESDVDRQNREYGDYYGDSYYF